jgi:hypothetical protein
MGVAARVCLLLCALIGTVTADVRAAGAADTGSLSGAVLDRTGQPIESAVVTISGQQLPIVRSVETGPNGVYRFEFLIPGAYTIDAARPGVGQVRRAVLVELGRDAALDLVIGLAVDETVTVTTAAPVVNVRSTEAGFNFQADTVNALPIERTYRGLFQLAPGVADNRSPVGPSAGGSRQDNTYLIDGANITNLAFGYLGTEVNELDIAEVNIKRAGISAEFGRTSGTVTNAISRSGSNTLSVIGRIDWLPQSLVSAYRLPGDVLAAGAAPGAFRDALLTSEFGPALGVGGPVVRDQVFFYGSARRFRQTKWDRVNKIAAPLPDEVRTGHEVYGKVSASAAPNHLITVSYRQRPNHVEHSGLSTDTAPTVGLDTDNGSRVATAEWAHFLSPSQSFDVRYLFMREKNEDHPLVDLGYLPPFDPSHLDRMGQFTDPAQANLVVGANQYTSVRDYRRHEWRGTFSQLIDLGRTSHTLKAGAGFEFGEEVLNRTANGWGLLATLAQNGVPALRARYYTGQPPQVGQGRTYALFLQDEAAIARRLSANAGVLLNRDDFSQKVIGSGGCPAVSLSGGAARYESDGDVCHFLRFGFADQVQPRLGAAYQVRPAAGDRLYVNWGRYSNMDQKSTARSLAPARIFQMETIFDTSGNVLSSGPLASTTGKLIDPDIKPIHTNEFLAGYETPLGRSVSVDVFFMSRSTHQMIEDVPSRLNGTAPDSGPFVAANLPCTRFEACQGARAERRYRAATIDLRRRLSGRWMGNVSYTWSRFEGNYDIDYSLTTSSTAIFNTSSFIQDGPGANVQDPNRYGPLFEDRPHVFKVFGSYDLTDRAMVSGYLRVQSGTPWAARGRDWAGASLNFLEPAGSHRNPVWTNLDVLGRYRLPAPGRLHASLELRLLNVFDTQTRLSTDAQQFLDLRKLTAEPYFAPYLQPNPFFGTGNAFAPPRRLHLAAVFSF